VKETMELDNARRFHDKKEDREGFEVSPFTSERYT
jgi:hypothetical protein